MNSSRTTLPPHAWNPSTTPVDARRAFTLIELLVVIAVIGILATMSVPAIKALSASNIRAQAINQIRAKLSEARSLALARHRQAGVVFYQETSAHALPVHGDQIAVQLFIEEYDQSTSPPMNPRNTLFVQASAARDYLPAAIAVAALNDAPGKTVITQESSGGHDLAILFDANGIMITRHGLARRNLVGASVPGTYPTALLDWNFATQGTTNPNSDNSSTGISSPGIFLYDRNEFAAQNIPAGAVGDAARATWMKQHASVVLVNANTGELLP